MWQLVAGDDNAGAESLTAAGEHLVPNIPPFCLFIKGEEREKAAGEAGMGSLHSLDDFLLFGGIDIFRDPRKLGCCSSLCDCNRKQTGNALFILFSYNDRILSTSPLTLWVFSLFSLKTPLPFRAPYRHLQIPPLLNLLSFLCV